MVRQFLLFIKHHDSASRVTFISPFQGSTASLYSLLDGALPCPDLYYPFGVFMFP